MATKMMLAFFFNLIFSVVELAGSLLTGSVAIASDALHDLGDAVTIGISCFLEKKSNRQPDQYYTYGYRRYSVLAGFFGTLILLAGSGVVISHAVGRIISPRPVHHDGMILFGICGVVFNGIAAYVTHGGESVNQRAVNLHMLEDVLGWIVVLFGAVVMKFTGIWWIDPVLSMGVALFLMINGVKNLKQSLNILLQKAPDGICADEIQDALLGTEGVCDVHHLHLWSMDGISHCATLHLVTNENSHTVKEAVREVFHRHGISCVTLELEAQGEHCHELSCITEAVSSCCHHHH